MTVSEYHWYAVTGSYFPTSRNHSTVEMYSSYATCKHVGSRSMVAEVLMYANVYERRTTFSFPHVGGDFGTRAFPPPRSLRSEPTPTPTLLAVCAACPCEAKDGAAPDTADTVGVTVEAGTPRAKPGRAGRTCTVRITIPSYGSRAMVTIRGPLNGFHIPCTFSGIT